MVYPVMVPSLLKVDFYILLLLLLSFNVDHAMSTNDYIDCRCSVTANYTDGSAFEVNMHSLFSILTNDALPTGFSNATVGVGSDTVHSLVQCRGDIDQDSCKECIRNSTQQVVGYCPYNMDAIIWYEKCQLRYSITNFFGQLNVEDYGYWYWINDKMEDAKAFNENLGSLLKIFTYQATTEPSRLMFATSNIPYDDQQTICGLVQCTRDISLAGCSLCLNSTIFKIRGTCENGHGCEVAAGSCRVRFDTELFYGTPTTPTSSLPAPPSNSSPTPSFNSLTPRPSPSFNSLPPSPNPSPPPPSLDSSATSSGASNTTSGQQKSAGRKHMYIIIAISVLTIVVLITCLICGFYWWKTEFCCLWRKKLKRGGLQSKEEEDDGFEQQVLRKADAIDGATLDLAIVMAATNDFAPNNKLGEGGFGAVYRGHLPDGQEIAVKRLSRNAGHGPKQFDNEVQTLAKLQHRNLVRLLGGFMEGEEKILVYEYVRNTSLDNFLFGEPTKHMQLDWPVRFKLINGIARGVLYLHEDSRLRTVHRDLKASNILLDEDMNPKISDFGNAKIVDTDQTQTETLEIMETRSNKRSTTSVDEHQSFRGYMAPEYLLEGRVSVKIDVYGFGVLLLEMITGKKNFSLIQQETDENLLNYVWRPWGENKALQVVDQILEGTCDNDEVLRCIHIGLLCVQEDASSRPKMSNVVAMLENSSLILPSILPPALSSWKIRIFSLGAQASTTISGPGSELG